MIPAQLPPSAFASYPPQARTRASQHLMLLRQLPLPFLPIFLSELIAYDWKMPLERSLIDAQLELLGALTPQQLADKFKPFASLRLNRQLETLAWIDEPAVFIQNLSAWLWSTDQMNAFHAAATAYNAYLAQAAPAPKPAMPRLGIVILGQGAAEPESILFQKLRPSGVFFNNVQPEDGLTLLLTHAAKRSRIQPQRPFAHWYIEGGTSEASALSADASALTTISFASLEPQRSALLKLTKQTIGSENAGPETMRRKLIQLTPHDLGFSTDPSAAVLNRFQFSLLSEGSGTEIFSTTFVQWAARECLRRAQPETILLRYAPRQQMRSMNAMLSGEPVGALDPEGSLVDAEMGAYYTWLDMQRLPGSERAAFLVWFEGRRYALAISPGLPAGTTSDSAMNLSQLLSLIS